LHYVDSFAGVRPPNFKRWNGAWSAPKVKGKVKRRLRRTTDDADKCWARASAVLSNPLSRREIVILMSNILSRNMLEAQSKLDDPEPEAFQIFYQLSSTWSACASMGAGLRLFCMP